MPALEVLGGLQQRDALLLPILLALMFQEHVATVTQLLSWKTESQYCAGEPLAVHTDQKQAGRLQKHVIHPSLELKAYRITSLLDALSPMPESYQADTQVCQ